MTKRTHHIMIGDTPWCSWTGSLAGQEINRKVGGITCGHTSGASADRGAKALRPHFKAGRVKVVAGCCPHSGA